MDVFVNKADQLCQVVIGFRTSNSHDDKQQLKSTELPQCAMLNGFRERDESGGSDGSATNTTAAVSP